MPKRLYIRTFGCQMNMHDSEKMAGVLIKEGYAITETPNNADLIIFNTCSIRQKAEQKFKSELGRVKSLKKKKNSLKIAVAGCIAQQQGSKLFKKNPHVDYVLGPQNINNLKDMIKIGGGAAVLTEDNPEIEHEKFTPKRKDPVKAWVSIMYGCNNFCSYCIVPYTRGRERSRPSEDIYNEICELASQGFREVTLLGQNVNSYKSDLNFEGLLERINSIEGIERIRFVTSHPRDLSEDVITKIKELPKVCEHIHLPLQSGSDRILELMNRGYTYGDYIKKIERLKKEIPTIAITTDIISGFPSETDNDHNSTIRALSDIEFDGIFAFNFSQRPGTKAVEMDDKIPDSIKSQRLSEILKLQDIITFNKNKVMEETIQEVLVEGQSKTDKGKMTGRTRTNKIVNFYGDNSLCSFLVNLRITKTMRHSLEGILE